MIDFLDRVDEIPIENRLACFDNDGTLWCEKPSYIQFDFFVDAMKQAIVLNPELASKPEFAALINDDKQAQGELGLARIAGALAGLFAGMSTEEFSARTREFMEQTIHSGSGRPMMSMVYQPMLELLDALRSRGFTIAIATGGGTEFVRAISRQLYDVPPELVVGTLIGYEYSRDANGVPQLARTTDLGSSANEGPNKVGHIQEHLGRRPVFAGGNSSGDREMLEWAAGGPGPGMALLVNHDDAEREYAYESLGATTSNEEPITDVGRRLGWTVVSMKDDWTQVFPS